MNGDSKPTGPTPVVGLPDPMNSEVPYGLVLAHFHGLQACTQRKQTPSQPLWPDQTNHRQLKHCHATPIT